MAQDDDQINNGPGDVFENILPLELVSMSTFSDSEKKVKPPAVPPKTYLEPKTETESEIETPSEKEAQSNDSDVDNCSLGSDSLYDLKLDKVGFQLPERIASQIAREPPRAIQGDKIPPRNLPRSQAKSTGPPKSSKSVQMTEEEEKDHARKHSSEADQDYQKIDPKMLNPLNRYEDHCDLSSKPQHNETTKEGSDATNRHASNGQENQYEPLRLKTMNKPSEYQAIGQSGH